MKPGCTLLAAALVGAFAVAPGLTQQSLAQQEPHTAANAGADVAGNGNPAPKGDGGNGSGGGNAAHTDANATSNPGTGQPAGNTGPTPPSNVTVDTAKKGGGPVVNDGSRKGANLPVMAGKGSEHIDLIRPDDGYANLRRRAARKILAGTATGGKPAPSIGLATVAPHAAKTSTNPVTHNAIGAVVANGAALDQKGLVATPHPGTNSIGVTMPTPSPTGPHVHAIPTATISTPGINGTTMPHHAAAVGGPAKLNTGINGTLIKPKF
jgi:hypothetical protein